MNDDSPQTPAPRREALGSSPGAVPVWRASSAHPLEGDGHLGVAGWYLRPFTLAVKPLFERYGARVDGSLCDYTFANNFIWLSTMSAFHQVIEDCFCLFALHGQELIMLLPPLGWPRDQLNALETCFAIMDRYNADRTRSRVDYVYSRLVAALDDAPGGPWRAQPALPDYVYRTADLIELRGNGYKSKRNEVNQFRRKYPDCRTEPLGSHHRTAIATLMDAWTLQRLRHGSFPALGDFLHTMELERQAIHRAMSHYDVLGLRGLALFVGAELQGFTFGEKINPQVASVLVEKTNVGVEGAAQYLFREFAKTFADCPYINAGDDLGLDNLRRVKESYRPARLEPRYTLQRQEAAHAPP